MFHNYGEIEALHQKLSSEKLPETMPKLRQRGLLSYSEEAGAWVYPFVGPDKSIMGRTERARHLLDGERPAQVWKSMLSCRKLGDISHCVCIGYIRFGSKQGAPCGRRPELG